MSSIQPNYETINLKTQKSSNLPIQIILNTNQYTLPPDSTLTRVPTKSNETIKHTIKAIRNSDKINVQIIRKGVLNQTSRLQTWREIYIGSILNHENVVNIIDNWLVLDKDDSLNPIQVYYVVKGGLENLLVGGGDQHIQ